MDTGSISQITKRIQKSRIQSRFQIGKKPVDYLNIKKQTSTSTEQSSRRVSYTLRKSPGKSIHRPHQKTDPNQNSRTPTLHLQRKLGQIWGGQPQQDMRRNPMEWRKNGVPRKEPIRARGERSTRDPKREMWPRKRWNECWSRKMGQNNILATILQKSTNHDVK